jgi:hypothetical protein
MNEILLSGPGRMQKRFRSDTRPKKGLGRAREIMWNPKNYNVCTSKTQVVVTKKRTAWKVEVEGIL